MNTCFHFYDYTGCILSPTDQPYYYIDSFGNMLNILSGADSYGRPLICFKTVKGATSISSIKEYCGYLKFLNRELVLNKILE